MGIINLMLYSKPVDFYKQELTGGNDRERIAGCLKLYVIMLSPCFLSFKCHQSIKHESLNWEERRSDYLSDDRFNLVRNC